MSWDHFARLHPPSEHRRSQSAKLSLSPNKVLKVAVKQGRISSCKKANSKPGRTYIAFARTQQDSLADSR